MIVQINLCPHSLPPGADPVNYKGGSSGIFFKKGGGSTYLPGKFALEIFSKRWGLDPLDLPLTFLSRHMLPYSRSGHIGMPLLSGISKGTIDAAGDIFALH